MTARAETVRALRRARPRSPFVRWSLGALCLLMAGSWFMGGLSPGGLPAGQRMANLQRFLGELAPWPLRSGEGSLGAWLTDILWNQGLPGMWTTFLISVAAICLAGLFALLGLPGASRNLAAPSPLLTDPGPPRPGWPWRLLSGLTRGLQMLARAIPEYFYAFFLIALLGLGIWPAVLALAIHNGGILGRLGAESVENVAGPLPRTLRRLGAGRLQILLLGIFPIVLPRFLVYFFYRWETCVRDATVLGLLGVPSLGYYILDVRAKDRYDEMLLLVLLGALLVIAGDFVSGLVRRRLRAGGAAACY